MSDSKKDLPIDDAAGDEWDSVIDAWEKNAFSDKHFDEQALASVPPAATSVAPPEIPVAAASKPTGADIASLFEVSEETVIGDSIAEAAALAEASEVEASEETVLGVVEVTDDDEDVSEMTSIASNLDELRAQTAQQEPEQRISSIPTPLPATTEEAMEMTVAVGSAIPTPAASDPVVTSAPPLPPELPAVPPPLPPLRQPPLRDPSTVSPDESVTFLAALDDPSLSGAFPAQDPVRISLDPEVNAIDALLSDEPVSSVNAVPSERSLGAMFPVGTDDSGAQPAQAHTVEFPIQRAMPVKPESEPPQLASLTDEDDEESNVLTIALDRASLFPPVAAPETADHELAALDALVGDRVEPAAIPGAPPVESAPLPPPIAPIAPAAPPAHRSVAPPPPLPAVRGPLTSLTAPEEVIAPSEGERIFPDERPAAEVLSNEQRRGFAARAEWIAEEARRSADAEAKARGLLTASELWALSGDATQAEMLALEAEELAPRLEMVRRQVRGFAALMGDDARVRESLAQESRDASTEEARAHASFMQLRIERRQGERDVQRVLAAASRHQQQDGAALALLDDALEGNTDAATLAEHSAFGAAIAELRSLFGHIASPDGSGLEHDWFHAQRALAHLLASEEDTRVPEVVERLRALGARIPELLDAVHWLSGAFGAEHASTRADAATALRSLSGRPGRDRMLAALLLQHGDEELGEHTGNHQLAELAQNAAGFSAEERAALCALAAIPQAYAAEDALGAALGALGWLTPNDDTALDRAIGHAHARVAVRAARRVAAQRSLTALEGALLSNERAGAETAVAVRLLRDQGRLEELADLLLRGGSAIEQLAAAVLAEVAGKTERASTSYREAHRKEPALLAAARAVRALSPAPTVGHDPDLAAALLAAAEDANGPLRASLLIELLARDELASEKLTTEIREGALAQLQEADEVTGLASFLGEDLARARGDRAALLGWIEARKNLSNDDRERVLETVRELLLYVAGPALPGHPAPAEANPEDDAEQAAIRAEQAHKSAPADLALRELYEGLAAEPPSDAADYRLARAKELSGTAQSALQLEAALIYEEQGNPSAALRVLKSELAHAEPNAHSWLQAATTRIEALTGESERLAEQLMSLARESDDRVKRLEAYSRLADLDAHGRHDPASALLWHRTILEEDPHHLPSLRYVEHALISGGRHDELEPLASSIAHVLASSAPVDTAGEASAHAELAARLRLQQPDAVWTQVRDLVELAFQQPVPSLWAIRTLNAHARHGKDDGAILKTTLALLARVSEPADRATLLVRAAEAAARLGRADEARGYLEQAVEVDADDVTVWGLLVEAREATGDLPGAAEACEQLARASCVDGHKLVAYYEAGRIWLDAADDSARATAAFEQAAAIDPSHADLFERLSQLYASQGNQGALADLLERRLASVDNDDERILLEVELARTLEGLGELAQARATLERTLSVKPDHAAALAAYADLAFREQDFSAAEDAWLRLARLLSTPSEQRQVYERLAELYTRHAVNLPRAEAAWKEVLRRAPEHEHALRTLVEVYRAQNDIPRAVETFDGYLKLAVDSNQRQERLIELARLYEESQNARKAEQVLEGARREFPTSVLPLRALAEFYLRQRQIPAMNILLDRAASDARRAIAAGRFTSAVFQTLGTAAELRKNADATRVVAATVAAFEGRPSPLDGASLRAADPRLDELLAPEILSPALRALLSRTGDALDNASPLDLRSLGATQPTPAMAPTVNMLVHAGAQLGMQGLQVLVTPRLGRVCLPIGSSPPALLVGESLLSTQHDRARAFLVLRALKLVYMRASALVRTSAADLPVLVGAWVKVFNPSWVAPGLNPQAVAEVGRTVSAALPNQFDPNFGMMALEAAAALGTQTANLGSATLTWANRAALLAVGDPSAALDAVAWGLGQDALPTDPEARAAWIARTQDARELLAFSVSEPYLEARRRLGLA